MNRLAVEGPHNLSTLRHILTMPPIVAVWLCGTQLLQQHYAAVVAPAVERNPAEAATCTAGLTALTRAVEGRAAAALDDALLDLANQARLPPK